MSDSLDLFRRAMIKGYNIEELRRKYQDQVALIRRKFPRESAARILKDLTFQKFVENLVRKDKKTV